MHEIIACVRERERVIETERRGEGEDRKRRKVGGWTEPTTEQEVKIQKEKQSW